MPPEDSPMDEIEPILWECLQCARVVNLLDDDNCPVCGKALPCPFCGRVDCGNEDHAL